MGLFSKETKIETADALFDKFNALSEEERNLFIGKIVPKQEPVEEPTSETTKQGEAKAEPNESQSNETQTTETNEQAVESENKPAEEHKESFEEMFKRFMAESKAELDAMKTEIADLKKAETPKQTETKPFGLAESSKEYKATYKPKETSKEFINRLFS